LYDAESLPSVGVSIVGPYPSSQIQVANTGVYSFLFSIQTDKTSGGGTSASVNIFLKLNGNNIPNSNSVVIVNNAIEILVACEFILPLTAGDILEVVGYTTGTNVRFLYVPPIGIDVPATPSIITNITRIA
jgi:hypothetical protein